MFKEENSGSLTISGSAGRSDGSGRDGTFGSGGDRGDFNTPIRTRIPAGGDARALLSSRADGSAISAVGDGFNSIPSGDTGTGAGTSSDRGATGDTGGGVVKRPRGRPRGVSTGAPPPVVSPPGRAEETLDEGDAPKPIDLPAKRRGRKSKTLELSEQTVTAGVVAVFAAVGVVSKHKHWHKSSTQVKPIAEPLTELLNTLPAEILDRIERSS